MTMDNIMTVQPLLAPERAGVVVVAAFALLSTTALGFILLRTIRLAVVVLFQRNDSTSRPPEILFFRTQLGHYSACLILSNLCSSAAGLINFHWVSRSGMSQGFTCSAQAVLRQIGIWATCSFTITLGVHTLVSFVFRIRPSRWRSLVAVTIGWSIALIAALAPTHGSDVYGFIGPSCGFTRDGSKDVFDTFALEALPVIITAFVTIVVYFVTFIVLRRKPCENSIQSPRDPNSNRRGERSAEYHRFICTIIWTMFWFPFAFVLLLLPFCVTHIVMFTGQPVPFAFNVFADVCVSMLGFVNVFLFYNTIRVIGPVFGGRRSARLFTDTMKTFGNDASGESPIARPFFPPSIWLDEKSPQLFDPAFPASSHSRDPSWASVYSDTGLLGKEKVVYESIQAKLASRALNTVAPPPKLISRPIGGNPPLRSTIPDLCTPCVPLVTRDIRPEPQTEGPSIANTDAPRKELIFKSKAPPELNIPPPLNSPPLLTREVTNKSSTLAARLGTSAASPVPSHTSVVRPVRKLDQENERVSVSHVTELPRIEVNFKSIEHEDESNHSTSSRSSYSESDSDYSGEIMHVHKVWPLPVVPELDGDEQGADDCPPSPSMRTRSDRFTVSTIWSQETGYTFSQPDTAAREMYPVVADLLVPGVLLGDKADIGGVVNRPTPSGPRSRPKARRAITAGHLEVFDSRLGNVWSKVSR